MMRARWWHLDVLDAALLWNPDGWEYDDSSGNTRRISGWPDQADVIVTVIDTGVDDHRDFRSRLVESRGDGGQFDTWLDDDCHHSGDNAHGTHVSGLIAAEQGNGYATAGIAPLAQVLPINLLRESCYSNYPSYGNATASVWAAIDRGTYVINMSFRWYPEYDNQGADDVFKASLVVAQQQFDIVVVAAAGNCGNPKHFNVQNKFSTTKCPKGQNMRHAPQMYDSDELDVISVAAIRRDHRRTSFSTVNRDVDIAAPGHNLLSTHPTTCIISLCRDETVFMSGTSQAAPLVSGVVAHMRARYPQATPNEIATALYDTATHRPAVQTDSTGRSDKYGHGIINPKAAIEALDQMMWPDPITGPARYAEPFSRVAAGAIHTCALRDDDTVACWGDNQHGQADAPSGTFNAVSAGRYHSCALRTNGTLACWGLNDRGQADPPAGSDFRGVTSGGGHSCALKDDDTVACWGDNEHGQRETPAGRLIAISAGGDQSCAVRASGTVVCWGDPGSLPSSSIYDRFNAVSSGTAHSCGLRTDDSIGCWSGGLLDDSREVVTDVPSGTFTAISAHGNNACGLRSSGDITCWGEQLEGEVEGPFTAVTVGLFHMCATRPNGSVECRGDNDYGQTDVPPLAADSQSEATTHTPRPVGQFSAVSAGQFHSCGLRTNGTIQCWGDNNDGQTDAPAGTFSAVTAGGVHSCGLRTNGTIQCWGENYYGEADAPAGTFSAVTAGRGHSCGLRTNGTIQCWGENYYGEADAPAGTFSAVTAGGVLSCGLRTNGTIQCWGYNHDGQTDAPAGTFSAVSAGTFHSCGLRTNGTIQCWGGDGLADAPAATFSAVTAGSHSCGLRTNGTIQCWGNNYDGQTDAPEGTFNAVTAGRAHSCGLRTDGSIQCWGDNRHGQTDTPQPGS